MSDSEIEVSSAKFAQPVSCKCGRPLATGDIQASGDTCRIVCSACHASVLEIEFDIHRGYIW